MADPEPYGEERAAHFFAARFVTDMPATTVEKAFWLF
jgi:hypothetical protein